MNKLYGLAAFTLAVTTAFFAGVNSGADSLRERQSQSRPIQVIEPGPLKQQVIQQEVIKIETKTEYVMPEQCLRSIQAAIENYEAVSDLIADTSQLKKIVETLASAIVNEKVTELNVMRGQLRKYESDILSSVLALGGSNEALNFNNSKCSEIMGEQALAAP